MWDGMPGWGWFGFGLLHMILFWGLVVLAIAALVKWLRTSSDTPRDALQILEQRYARGEIERDEYLRKAADLRGSRGPGDD